MKRFFITAIGTDSGKTVVSAILCEALNADYWKPIQSGLPRDTETVASLVANHKSYFHPERYLLKTPISPHASARIDGVQIGVNQLSIPDTKNTLVIEGAGGCLVPINDKELMIDVMGGFRCPVIVVSNHYLGSINHTLLTLRALVERKLELEGIVFNGDPNPETENIILRHFPLRVLLKIPRLEKIDKETVRQQANALDKTWYESIVKN